MIMLFWRIKERNMTSRIGGLTTEYVN